jgi:hypothetical protein
MIKIKAVIFFSGGADPGSAMHFPPPLQRVQFWKNIQTMYFSQTLLSKLEIIYSKSHSASSIFERLGKEGGGGAKGGFEQS